METSTYKTSTIFVSTGRRTRVFRSLDAMPSDLRRKMNDHLAGPNTGTLIVADRRGREYLVRALKRTACNHPPRQIQTRSGASASWSAVKAYWLEIGLIALLGVASWTLFYLK